jgi:hypothetical protein
MNLAKGDVTVQQGYKVCQKRDEGTSIRAES